MATPTSRRPASTTPTSAGRATSATATSSRPRCSTSASSARSRPPSRTLATARTSASPTRSAPTPTASSPALSAFSISANLSLIGSSIDVEGASRPLQGQSPYVVNVDLGYASARQGTTVDVLYNVFGRRIEEVGTGGVGNVYEEPIHRLDLSLSQALRKDLKLKLAATNLLDQRSVRTQNGVEILTYDLGVAVLASVELSVD